MRFGNVESFLARKGFYGKSVTYYTIESTYNILRNVYKLKEGMRLWFLVMVVGHG
jgi:hypothetical protein